MKLKRNQWQFLLFVVWILVGFSCKKEAGEGGTSTITGKVFVKDYNGTFTTLIGQYYAQKEDVFIIYGDQPAVGDKMETNYDGTYQFRFLREGKYKIYAYSKDSTFKSPSGNIPIIQTVEITDSDQNVTVPDIVILK